MDDDLQPRDRCPVCGSDPVTHPNLRFKINTRCYHRICEGCVDRHFNHGKADCPVAGCSHSLWRREWRTQTFEDLKIEREVEVRKRVGRTLDRQENEFETKRDYDDFLELREEMIMNLVLKTDVAITNRKLRQYEIANGLKVAATEDATEAADAKKSLKKKDVDPTIADPSGLIKGLKKKVLRKAEAPYDPFMGMAKHRDYYQVKDSYVTRAKANNKPQEAMLAAGYEYSQYVDECLLRAFAGLGVFVEDEMATKNNTAVPVPGPGEVSTKVDDVF